MTKCVCGRQIQDDDGDCHFVCKECKTIKHVGMEHSNHEDICELCGDVIESKKKDYLIASLKQALNPNAWSLEMSDAWHSNIPNLQAAFAALLKEAERTE